MSQLIPKNIVIVDPITGQPANVEENGGLAVNVQDQHSTALDLNFIQAQQPPTTVAAAVTAGDTTVTVTDTTGFVDGTLVLLTSPSGQFFYGDQIGAPAAQVLSLDRPIDDDYIIGDISIAASKEMNVVGSIAAPEIFQIGPVGVGTGIEVDITRVMGWIQDGSAMDDSLFGGMSPLTYGIQIRKNISGGDYVNYWNAKFNGEIALVCYDFTYSDRAPAGSFGLRFRNTYAGQSKHGVTIRLDPGDTLEVLVQDDLTDLEEFHMMGQGHLVTDL